MRERRAGPAGRRPGSSGPVPLRHTRSFSYGLGAAFVALLGLTFAATAAQAQEPTLAARPASPGAPSLGGTPSASAPRTAAQLAAQEGLTYKDEGSFVLLFDANVRLRLYPGTNSVVVDGDEVELKDRLRRESGELAITDRIARYLSGRVQAARTVEPGIDLARVRADEQQQRDLEEARRRDEGRKLAREELRRKRKEREAAQTPPAAAPRARSLAAADPAWVPSVSARSWRWIVLHHSDDTSGDLEKYNEIHLNERRWEHGCGYHFVIGNGSQSRDGEVEISKRWRQQLQGAHAKTPDNRYNELGVGIVLVGDFEAGSSRPTARQMESLVSLCRWLMDEYGIGADSISGHCHVGKTCCPGRNFPWAELRQRLER